MTNSVMNRVLKCGCKRETKEIVFMIYANKKSVKKVVHVKECSYLKNKKQKNIIIFSDMREALKHGYTLCQKCNPIKKQYLREEIFVNNFARANNLKVEFHKNEINVQSSLEQWKIVVDCDGSGMALYHRNTENRYNDNYVPNYHNQGVARETIVDYLKYIVKHDIYKKNEILEQKNFFKKKSYHVPKKHKEKKEKRSTEAKNNILQLLKRLHSEEVYKDFLCYVIG